MSADDHCALLWDHLDGTLTAGDESKFRDHVGHCATCMADLAEHEVITEALRGGGDEEPPPVIRTALLAEFRSLHGRATRWPKPVGFRPRWAFPVPAWAAAALLGFGILAGVWLAPRGGPEEGSPIVPATDTEAPPIVLTYSVYQPDGSVRTVSRLARPAGVQGR